METMSDTERGESAQVYAEVGKSGANKSLPSHAGSPSRERYEWPPELMLMCRVEFTPGYYCQRRIGHDGYCDIRPLTLVVRPTESPSDLVERLRLYGSTTRPEDGTDSFSLLYEAADEIERLTEWRLSDAARLRKSEEPRVHKWNCPSHPGNVPCYCAAAPPEGDGSKTDG